MAIENYERRNVTINISYLSDKSIGQLSQARQLEKVVNRVLITQIKEAKIEGIKVEKV